MHPDDEPGLVASIVAYLDRHPLAADSPEGAARWWLGPAHDGVTVEQVERALDLLVARGVMRRLPLADGTFLYSQTPATRQ